MANRELAIRLVRYVEDAVADLDDVTYCDVLEEISCDLDASVEAKREELKRVADE